MNVIPTDTFGDMLNALEAQPDKVVLCQEMRKGVESNHATLTCATADFALSLYKKDKDQPLIRAFTFDEKLDITELSGITSPKKLRKRINAQTDAIAYSIMLRSKHIRGDDIEMTEAEVQEVIKDSDDAEAALTAKGVKLKEGITSIMVTNRGLWSVALIEEDGIDMLAMSDWEGNMPLSFEQGAAEMKHFNALFDNVKPITKAELKELEGSTKQSIAARAQIKELMANPEEAMTKLLEKDGHNGYEAAYAALIKLSKAPDLRKIPVEHRQAVIAVFQNRINALQMSLAEDEVNALQAPTTIQ